MKTVRNRVLWLLSMMAIGGFFLAHESLACPRVDQITIQPTPFCFGDGATVHISVVIPPASDEWPWDPANTWRYEIKNAAGVVISSGTANEPAGLTITPAMLTDAGKYWIRASALGKDPSSSATGWGPWSDWKEFTALKVEFKKDEVVVCWSDGKYDAAANLTADTFDRNRLKWKIKKEEGKPAKIGEDTGLVTFGKGGGKYTITAESKDLKDCSDSMTLTVLKVEITPSATNVCSCVGSVDFDLTSDSFTPGGVRWSIEPSDSASIDQNGTVIFPDVGTNYTITATSLDNADCFDTVLLTVLNDMSQGDKFYIPIDFGWQMNDLCGNTLKVGGVPLFAYKLYYNGVLVGQCPYGGGLNDAWGWMTKDGCRFHSTFWKSYDNMASGPNWYPFDEGTPGKWDIQQYDYDCIAQQGFERCLESDYQYGPATNSVECEPCETTNGCVFPRVY